MSDVRTIAGELCVVQTEDVRGLPHSSIDARGRSLRLVSEPGSTSGLPGLQ